jgi:hypothetical protein
MCCISTFQQRYGEELKRLMMDEAKKIARECATFAPRFEQRTGQWLFNYLPSGAMAVVSRSPINPYYLDMTQKQIEKWVKNHLILDGQRIIRVHIGKHTLWESDDGTHSW